RRSGRSRSPRRSASPMRCPRRARARSCAACCATSRPARSTSATRPRSRTTACSRGCARRKRVRRIVEPPAGIAPGEARRAKELDDMANRTGDGQTALVTGASYGIGVDLAECFAQDGYELVLSARSESALVEQAERIAKEHRVKVTPIALDL